MQVATSCLALPLCASQRVLKGQVLTRTVLSQPHETSRLSGLLGGLAESRQPGGVAGAQETAMAPIACALST